MTSLGLADFLTADEILKAVKLKSKIQVHDEIIMPNFSRISSRLEHKHTAEYLSEAIELVMIASGSWTKV